MPPGAECCAQQAAKHYTAACSLPPAMMRCERESEVQELMGQDKQSFLGKAKAVQASKINISFTNSSQQAGLQTLPEKQGSSYVTVTWEVKCAL